MASSLSFNPAVAAGMNLSIGNTAANVATQVTNSATSGSVFSGLKKLWYFYGGEGGKDLGTALHTTRKAGTKFKLGQAMADSFAKHETAQKIAGTAAETGIFKGIGKFIGKAIGPAMLIVPELISAYQEIKNGGGIGGALKSLAKGAINLASWPIASFAVAALGITGGWALFATIGASMLLGMATKKFGDMVLGKTKTELLAEQQVQQGGQTQGTSSQYGSNPRSLAAIDTQIKETDEFLRKFDINNNSCISTTPSYNNYGNTNRQVYIA